MKNLIADVHLPPKERALTCDREKDMTFSTTQELSLLRYRCMAETERTGRFEMFSEAIRFICNRVPKQLVPCGALSSARDCDEGWWARD